MSQIDYDVWIGIVDETCKETAGRSYYDLLDLLHAEKEWEVGTPAKMFANQLIAEVGLDAFRHR